MQREQNASSLIKQLLDVLVTSIEDEKCAAAGVTPYVPGA
jgi:hypothetical protein